MSLGYAAAQAGSPSERVRETVALLRRRGFAVSSARLAELCIGGALDESEMRWAIAACPDLTIAENLVIERDALAAAPSIRKRAAAHEADAQPYLQMTLRFVQTLVTVAPFIRSVSIAGSLATGGFRASDDVDLNLIVDDGHRHTAYVVVNILGVLHAAAHRHKPVDDLTRRPIAPRLMTANLILERSQCFPLLRQDADMAFELFIAEPVFGLDAVREVIDRNPGLLEHFPQLADRRASRGIAAPSWRVPRALFPKALDGIARLVGENAWRYMQWTRRHRPDALARVAYVRATMRPYTLFDT